MKTKVLIVIHDEKDEKKGGGSLQEKINKAVEALGDGWTVRSAFTHSCTRGYTSYIVNARIYWSDPITIWTTTIVMEQQ